MLFALNALRAQLVCYTMAKTKGEAREAAKNGIVKKKRDEANVGKAVGNATKKGDDDAISADKPDGPKKVRLSDLATGGGIKKPHRFHNGTRALMDIRKYQRMGKFATMTLIPKKIVYRVIKEELAQLGTQSNVDFKVKRKAFADLHQAFEQELLKQMQGANMVGIHAGHQGIEAADFQAANLIRENHTARPLALPGFAIKGKRVRKRSRAPRPKKSEQAKAAVKKVFQGGKQLQARKPRPAAKPVQQADFGDDETSDGEEEEQHHHDEVGELEPGQDDASTSDSQATAS